MKREGGREGGTGGGRAEGARALPLLFLCWGAGAGAAAAPLAAGEGGGEGRNGLCSSLRARRGQRHSS